jgi:hypothetical protein
MCSVEIRYIRNPLEVCVVKKPFIVIVGRFDNSGELRVATLVRVVPVERDSHSTYPGLPYSSRNGNDPTKYGNTPSPFAILFWFSLSTAFVAAEPTFMEVASPLTTLGPLLLKRGCGSPEDNDRRKRRRVLAPSEEMDALSEDLASQSLFYSRPSAVLTANGGMSSS